VTFLLPDATTRTLVDFSALPAVGSDVVVLENRQEIVSFLPAVTNFVGQVVAVDDPFVTRPAKRLDANAHGRPSRAGAWYAGHGVRKR
jgi:hypothetical protein